jgi:hypothetical protein
VSDAQFVCGDTVDHWCALVLAAVREQLQRDLAICRLSGATVSATGRRTARC